MLGHKVWQVFRDRFDAWVTMRSDAAVRRIDTLFVRERTLTDVRANDLDSFVRACDVARPDVVVNCVGIVKQLPEAKDPIASLTVNALFPHRAAAICSTIGARFIHISTDCVFSGRCGAYRECDVPDADDLYGRSKLLGEVTGAGALTLRTSIVGRELSATTGLVEWLLSQRGGRVTGYTRAVFSGVTTGTLASLLADVVERHPDLTGLYHVASKPISKYDLLCAIDQAFGTRIRIEPSDKVRMDRSLDGSRFSASTGLTVPEWGTMLAAMAADPTPYEQWRQASV